MSKLLVTLTVFALINIAFSTVCKDGSSCPGTFTCCLTPRGVGCCPYENASCCNDGLHCCPNGFTCDVSGGRCVKSSNNNEFLTFLDTTDAMEKTTASTPEVKIQGAMDWVKCAMGVKPIIGDVTILVEAIKNKDMKLLEEFLVKIAKDAPEFIEVCKKAFGK